MTRVRKMMLEELQRRNYSENTIRHYIRTVEEFARYFHCSPDRLGPRHIREYQVELLRKGKTPSTVTQRLAALRFFYVKTVPLENSDLREKIGIMPFLRALS